MKARGWSLLAPHSLMARAAGEVPSMNGGPTMTNRGTSQIIMPEPKHAITIIMISDED